MAIAPELLAAGAEGGAEGGTASAVKSSGKMPRQPAYLTRKQAGQYTSDNAEYQDMKRREAGQSGGSPRPRRSSSGGGGGRRSSGPAVGRVASQTLRNVTPGGRTTVVTKLFYALFAGLVALELGSLATGRRFAIQIPRPGGPTTPTKPVYQTYYAGQPAAPAQPAATNPYITNFSPGPVTSAVADSGLGHAASYFSPGGSGFVATDVGNYVATHPAQATGVQVGFLAGLRQAFHF